VFRAAAWAHQEWMLRSAWEPMLERVLDLAVHAFDRPGRRLDPAATGRWALAADGALTPDGVMANVEW